MKRYGLSILGVVIHSNYIVETDIPNCPKSSASALSRGFLGRDYEFVISGSRELENCVHQLADDPRWSKLKFASLGGGTPGPNFAIAEISPHEIRYYHGAICAAASKTGSIGIVTSTPRTTPVVSRGVSAFALGARSIRPDIRLYAGITSNRLSYVAGRKVAATMIKEANVDCLVSQQLDLTVNQVASQAHRYSMGVYSDSRMFVDEYVLSSMLLHWEKAMEPFYRFMLAGTWIPNYRYYIGLPEKGIESGGESSMMQREWFWETEHLWTDLANSSRNVFCSPDWTDPQFTKPENMELVAPNVSCMKKHAWVTMVGVTNMVNVVVEFNSTHSPYVYFYYRRSEGASIFIYVFATLLECAILATAIHAALNVNHPIYRTSSPFFLLVTLAGIAIGISSAYVVPGPRTHLTCMLRWWIMGVSYAIVFSCILAKNWRVWKIFSRNRLKVHRILDWHLVVKWVAVIVTIEIIILIFWTLFDPWVPTQSPSPDRYDVIQITCESKGKGYIYIIFWIYNLLLLLPVVIIGYGTRHARSEYRELKPLVFTSYVAMVSIFLLMAIDLGLKHRPTLQFWIHGLAPILAAGNAWLALYIPNIHQAYLYSGADTPSIRESGLETAQRLNSHRGRVYSGSHRNTRSLTRDTRDTRGIAPYRESRETGPDTSSDSSTSNDSELVEQLSRER